MSQILELLVPHSELCKCLLRCPGLQEQLHFTRQQRKQLAWLWRTYNEKMQSLMPRRQQLMDRVNAADALTTGLPIHRPGQAATSMLGSAEALVDHLKLMQVTLCFIPRSPHSPWPMLLF